MLSIAQMPTGVPVATVSVDDWKNATMLAIEILSPRCHGLVEKLMKERDK